MGQEAGHTHPLQPGNSAAVTGLKTIVSPTCGRSQRIVALSDGSSNESGLPGGNRIPGIPQPCWDLFISSLFQEPTL